MSGFTTNLPYDVKLFTRDGTHRHNLNITIIPMSISTILAFLFNRIQTVIRSMTVHAKKFREVTAFIMLDIPLVLIILCMQLLL